MVSWSMHWTNEYVTWLALMIIMLWSVDKWDAKRWCSWSRQSTTQANTLSTEKVIPPRRFNENVTQNVMACNEFYHWIFCPAWLVQSSVWWKLIKTNQMTVAILPSADRPIEWFHGHAVVTSIWQWCWTHRHGAWWRCKQEKQKRS